MERQRPCGGPLLT